MDADHAGTVWRDDMWLQTYPLSAHTAIDYFSCSPFWDPTCNNVRARLEQKQLRFVKMCFWLHILLTFV